MALLTYRGVTYESKHEPTEVIPKTKLLFSEGKETVNFKAGDIIFEKGEKGKSMYSIVEGEVDVVIDGQVVDTLTSREIFGEMAVIDQETRSATIKAKTDSKINVIDQQKFLSFVQENPNFALDIMSVLSNRLRKMDDLIAFLTEK
jgi:CRP-like cAMP-binding protein